MLRGNDVLGQQQNPVRSVPPKTVGLFHTRNQSSIVYGSDSVIPARQNTSSTQQKVKPKENVESVRSSISNSKYPEPKSQIRRPQTAYNHEKRKSWVFDQSSAQDIRNSIRLQSKTSKTFTSSALPTERSMKEEQSKRLRPQTTGGMRGNLGSGCSVLSHKPSFDFCSSDRAQTPKAKPATQRKTVSSPSVIAHAESGSNQASPLWSSDFKTARMSHDFKKKSSKITKSTLFDKDKEIVAKGKRSKTLQSTVFDADPPAPKPVTSAGEFELGSYQHNKKSGTTSKINSTQSASESHNVIISKTGKTLVMKASTNRPASRSNQSTVFKASQQAPVKTRNVISLQSTAVTQVFQGPPETQNSPLWSSDFHTASMTKPGLQRSSKRAESRLVYGSQ